MFKSGNFKRFFFVCPFPKGSKKEATHNIGTSDSGFYSNSFQKRLPLGLGQKFFEKYFGTITIFNLDPPVCRQARFRDGAKQIENVKLYLPAIILFFLSILSLDIFAQRFPKPEFESGFLQEPNRLALSRSNFWEYFDVLVLLVSMSLMTWLVLKKRSRRGVFWISIFSILYFGFFREGCVCSVGSLQNITLALFEPGYHIPLTVIAFFLIPLIFALFFGRTFCAGVCPLGAIQDLVVWKPIQLKPWLQKSLGMIPFIYLGLGVLYAATATDFVICRYDPFVGFYRLDAEFSMFALGGVFLLIGVFIARPYCRFFCPYGVLLNWMSRFSKHHMSITPNKCIQCKLCETSCPFGAIEIPETNIPKEPKKKSIRRFISLAAIIPALVIVGVWTGHQFYENLAKVNPKVKLAKEVMELKELGIYEIIKDNESLELEAYRRSGQATIDLYIEAQEIINEFRTGSMWLGGFLGLVFGFTLAGLSIFRYREDYEPNRGNCFSCARCMDYCPVEPE